MDGSWPRPATADVLEAEPPASAVVQQEPTPGISYRREVSVGDVCILFGVIFLSLATFQTSEGFLVRVHCMYLFPADVHGAAASHHFLRPQCPGAGHRPNSLGVAPQEGGKLRHE